MDKMSNPSPEKIASETAEPLTAQDIYGLANRGETIPAIRALATYADPANWVQLYDSKASPGSAYKPRACEWAFVGPVRPGYELAQNAKDDHRQLAVDALNELQALRKQIIHGGAWTKKVDELFERARKAGL